MENLMNDRDFFAIYLPALEQALHNDEINFGFLVKGPDYYVDDEHLQPLYKYIDINVDKFKIFDMAGFYFDAKSHNFPDVGVVSTQEYRELIMKEVLRLRSIYALYP